jgi:hypothetical protein
MGMQEQPAGMQMAPHMNGGGHLYMQTNEVHNCIIRYHRSPDGTLRVGERPLWPRDRSCPGC